MPHGHCYLWQPTILWTHVISDLFIAAAYFSIPFALYYIRKQRRDWQYTRLFVLFSLFIFWCGVTHLMGIVTIWHGIYGIHGVTKIITAVVSFFTAIVLLKFLPKILMIPSVRQIEEVNRKLAEEKITNSKLEAERESQRLINITLNAAPIGLMAIDRFGTIRIANPEVTNILGHSNEQLVGKPVVELLEQDDTPSLLHNDQIQKFIEQEGSTFTYVHESVVYGKTNSGSTIPLEIRMHGEIISGEQIIFVSISDQSFKLKAAQDSARLTAIIKSCDDAIIGKTLSGVVTDWNPAAESLYGYTKAEMIGQHISKLAPPELVDEIDKIHQSLRDGHKVDHLETVRVRKDGTKVDVMLTISPINDIHGNPIGASTIARDITHKKLAERQLELKNKALLASNQELEQFAFIASHDLKEPLRKIISFGRIIKDEVESQLSEQSREFLGYMLNATERMQTLLESLLSYSRVTSRAKPFEEVALSEVIKDVISDLQLLIDESQATIECEVLPVIKADRAQMHQLFQNLIGNSLKYRRSDVRPHIQIRSEKPDLYTVVITVQDNGIGFEQEHQTKIFEMFKRLHGRQEYEGIGVGLAICKKIVERHGGAITASGKPNEGAVFRITFFQLEDQGQNDATSTHIDG